MRNPVKALAFKLRNGNGGHASLGAAAAPSREADMPVASRNEAEAGQSSALVVGEPYIEIWDNDEDAIYDAL